MSTTVVHIAKHLCISGSLSKVWWQVALLLLDLQLGECAQQALQAAGKGQGEEEVPGLEMALCCSKAASLTGDDTGRPRAIKAEHADLNTSKPAALHVDERKHKECERLAMLLFIILCKSIMPPKTDNTCWRVIDSSKCNVAQADITCASESCW